MTRTDATLSNRHRQGTATDTPQLMQVNCRRFGSSAVVVATGTMHTANAAMLEQVVVAAARDGLRLVIVDVAAIAAVDREGLLILTSLSSRTDVLVVVREGAAARRLREKTSLSPMQSKRYRHD